jgi:hypothetical protein
MKPKRFVVTEYMQYRANTRGFDVKAVESIVRYSDERYFDVETRRYVAIGVHRGTTVVIPYEETEADLTAVTVHAITRQQIRFRVNSGRFIYG